MSVEFRVVGPDDEEALAELFADIDDTFFQPHPFTADEARRIASHAGLDVYAILADGRRPVAYGMLRGWDEGYATPSLGIAVRTDSQGRGLGRLMMAHLHAEARRRGAAQIRLRVDIDNTRARRLYESLGYAYCGDDRGELVMLVEIQSRHRREATPGTVSPALNGELLSVDDPRWASFLAHTPHDVYHLPSYTAVAARQEGGEPRALLVEGDQAQLLLPLILRRIPGSDRPDATSAYGYPGPLWTGTERPTYVSEALVAGARTLRQEGVVSAFVRLHPLLNAAAPPGLGTIVEHGQTVSMDLTVPEDVLWGQMRLNHRRDIRRAIQLGFVARMDETFAAYSEFKRLYRLTMARRAASPYYLFDDTYFDDLRDALAGQLHLCVVAREGAVAGAGLFFEAGRIVQYHLSGTDENLEHVQPTKLMMDYVRRWARQRGDTCLHLGGGLGGAPDSLFRFKEGFSPLRHPFRTMRIVLDEEEYRRLVAARSPLIDPKDRSDYFPQYRQA